MLPSISPAVARRVSAKTSLRSLPEATRQYKMVRVPAVLEAFWAEFPEARRLWREDNGTLPLWDATPWAGGKRERCTANAVLGQELAAQTAASLDHPTIGREPAWRKTPRACPHCGASFLPQSACRIYCSSACSEAAQKIQSRAWDREKRIQKRQGKERLDAAPCGQCGEMFWPVRLGHRFCTPACQHKSERARRLALNAELAAARIAAREGMNHAR